MVAAVNRPRAGAGPADTDYRSELWAAANALRGSLDAAEYKHNIKVGGADARATDVLGGVYEYFLEHAVIDANLTRLGFGGGEWV